MSWSLIEFPLIVFALTFLVLWLSAETGLYLRRPGNPKHDERQDLNIILTATLTLLGLVIGFSFSMAMTRYDQRKNNEENEATAIGTEYVRAGLLPPAGASAMRELLSDYLNQRISFYITVDERRIEQINASTVRLQGDLWSTVQAAAFTRAQTAVSTSVPQLTTRTPIPAARFAGAAVDTHARSGRSFDPTGVAAINQQRRSKFQPR